MTPDDLVARIYEDFHNDEIFARESLSINNKLGETVPLNFGPAQQKLANIIARQRELGKPVRVIALKARQVWISTYVAARYWRDTTHLSGQHTLVLAQDDDTAGNIFKYYQTFDETYKPFRGMIGKPNRANDSSEILEYSNGSYIKFHTAKTTTVGRSRSLRRVHFSEFAFYGDNARALMAAVMSAVPGDADTEVIIESTANGVGNEFHQMWQRAVAGESEWIAFFFAWWEHPEYVRALEMAPYAFERSLSEEEREMRRQYDLTPEQLNWRRWCIANALNGDEDLFKQEFPSNAEQAFLTSGRPRFDHKAIARMPIIREALEGGLEMVDVGGHKKLIFSQRDRGDLVIFRKPQEHRAYIVGADTAEGIDVSAIGGKSKGAANPDFCVAQVHDRDTGEQVARWRARVQPGEFGWQLYMLGIYYFWAQIVPEVNNHGIAAIDSLLHHGYPPNLIYHRIDIPDQDPVERGDKIGFKTTPLTRPQMISTLDEAIRTGALIVHDPVTQSEMLTFVIKANGKAEHQYACHDDCVIGEALVCVGMQEMPRKEKPRLLPGSQTRVDNYRRRTDKEDMEAVRRRRLA